MVSFWCGRADRISEYEDKLLSSIKSPKFLKYTPIGNNNKLWTICLNPDSSNTPILLLHGLCAGIPFWVKNFDHFSAIRPVYALDILGFGKSSRPDFPSTCEGTEDYFVDSIYEFVSQSKLSKFILLGHSFGGYLATLFAIKYPDMIERLILADPWGFSVKPEESQIRGKLSFLRYNFIRIFTTHFTPLSMLRMVGPFASRAVKFWRGDLTSLFEDGDAFANYVVEANRESPTGEVAFGRLMTSFGYALRPASIRLAESGVGFPISFIYGSRSYISNQSGFQFREDRPDLDVGIHVIKGANHHVYLHSEFNDIVNNISNNCSP